MNTVQIGNLIIPSAVFDALKYVAASLVGGLITFLVMAKLETVKRKADREEKRRDLVRKAIAQALEWIEPLDNAMYKASAVASSFQQGLIDEDEFRKRYPLAYQLPIKDPPAELRVLLPGEAYPRLLAIVRGMDELKRLVLYRHKESFEQVISSVTGLQAQINELHKYLKEAYLQTSE